MSASAKDGVFDIPWGISSSKAQVALTNKGYSPEASVSDEGTRVVGLDAKFQGLKAYFILMFPEDVFAQYTVAVLEDTPDNLKLLVAGLTKKYGKPTIGYAKGGASDVSAGEEIYGWKTKTADKQSIDIQCMHSQIADIKCIQIRYVNNKLWEKSTSDAKKKDAEDF
jgi:hypothetical protein